MTIGIYKITNKKTGQIYIGQSINIEKRFKEHIRGIACPSSYIDNAIQKYGKDNFNFEIITQLPNNKKLLNTHEKYWIKFYNTYKNNFHYNLTIGGDGVGSGENHPFYGKKRSEETKKKISEANSGKQLSEETKKKISENHANVSGKNNPNYRNPNNYHHSEETKKKISEANSGKQFSEETKKKMSENHADVSGKNNPAWKNYARIIKNGKYNNKQMYVIRYQGKTIKQSFSIDKLSKWFSKNYPNQELIIEVR